jgi:hypothetical protein
MLPFRDAAGSNHNPSALKLISGRCCQKFTPTGPIRLLTTGGEELVKLCGREDISQRNILLASLKPEARPLDSRHSHLERGDAS